MVEPVAADVDDAGERDAERFECRGYSWNSMCIAISNVLSVK